MTYWRAALKFSSPYNNTNVRYFGDGISTRTKTLVGLVFSGDDEGVEFARLSPISPRICTLHIWWGDGIDVDDEVCDVVKCFYIWRSRFDMINFHFPVENLSIEDGISFASKFNIKY